LKTLGAFTLKVVLSKCRFGSESVATPMGLRAVTSPGTVKRLQAYLILLRRSAIEASGRRF